LLVELMTLPWRGAIIFDNNNDIEVMPFEYRYFIHAQFIALFVP
jgi:hypothetical protein